MLFADTYKTVNAVSEGVFSDKGSKFIAVVYPISSDSDVKQILSEIRSLHPKANHYCWAFRLSADRSVFRVNDDGEPSGTAGRPILNVLLSQDLTNMIIVVVRYFGGTLLGVPGLINAYKKASIEGLKNSIIVELTIKSIYDLVFDHSNMNQVMKIVKEENLTVRHKSLDNMCKMQIEVRHSAQERILEKFKMIPGINLKYISTL